MCQKMDPKKQCYGVRSMNSSRKNTLSADYRARDTPFCRSVAYGKCQLIEHMCMKIYIKPHGKETMIHMKN